MEPRNLNQKRKLLNRLEEAEKYFQNSEKYSTSLSLASRMYEQKNLIACKEVLDKLPTRDELLETLVSKLKGKSIYKTLRQIHENKEVDILTKIKGVSSLMTHCIIEMQTGSPEFGMLLPVLMEKGSDLIYKIWD